MLADELRGIGIADAEVDEHGYVYGTLHSTAGEDAPVVGLLAHVDTSPDAPGTGVEPIVHRGYDGGVVELPRAGTVLDPATMPVLGAKSGHDVVTSSGDTLLGADDKAGVAEIMAAVAHLAAHPELPRPTLRIGFTPDEEIGEGPLLFNYERFGAACAYTLDASQLGELQDETFSAAEITLDDRRGRRPPGLGHRQARQRHPPRRRASSPRSRRPAHAGDHLRPRGFHPPLRRPGRAARATVSAASSATSTTTCSRSTSTSSGAPPRRSSARSRPRGSAST